MTSTFARHSLNARNVIDWKRNFKEIILKEYLGERIKKDVVIIRVESNFFCISLRYEMSLKLHLILA